MVWAAVPEAPIDHHSELDAGEHDVSPAAPPAQERDVDAITQATSMEFPPQSQLGSSVSDPLALKPSPDCGG